MFKKAAVVPGVPAQRPYDVGRSQGWTAASGPQGAPKAYAESKGYAIESGPAKGTQRPTGRS
jgi:hypothetical protein